MLLSVRRSRIYSGPSCGQWCTGVLRCVSRMYIPRQVPATSLFACATARAMRRRIVVGCRCRRSARLRMACPGGAWGGGAPVVCRILGHGETPAGIAISLDWKLWVFPDGMVHFELRGPMVAIAEHTYQKSSFRLAHWLRTFHSMHEGLLLGVGFDYRDHMLPSSLSCKRRYRSERLSEVKAAYSPTTIGLLTVFGYTFTTRPCQLQVDIVVSLLIAFFTRVAPTAPLREQSISANSHQANCSELPVHDGWCCHMPEFIERLRECPDRCRHAALFLLRAIYEYRPALVDKCNAAKAVCKVVLRAIAKVVDTALQGGSFAVDVMSIRPRPAKRMRIDEDFKRFVAVGSVQQRRTRSVATLLRATGAGAASAGPKWEAAELAAYKAAGVRIFETSRVVSVASDGGARLGVPPEETIVYMVWSPEMGKSLIGPVQVALWAIPRSLFCFRVFVFDSA